MLIALKKQMTYDSGFLDRCMGLFLGVESGHMGADMYQHHAGEHNGQKMSGVFTWDNYAANGTIPRMERQIFTAHVPNVISTIASGSPVIGFGPTEGIRQLVRDIGSKNYIPVDSCAELLEREKKAFAFDHTTEVKPAVLDFFEGDAVRLINEPALGVLPGLTITNIPGPAPYYEPEAGLTHTFRHFSQYLPEGGYFLVTMDSNQDGDKVRQFYNEQLHKQFGVNFLYRMALELPTDGFSPDLFEYHPIWHHRSGLLAHTVRATKDQNFSLGADGDEIFVSVKKGDVFHYNNSFKYRPDFFEMCAQKAGFELEKVWKDNSSMKLYLFRLPEINKIRSAFNCDLPLKITSSYQ